MRINVARVITVLLLAWIVWLIVQLSQPHAQVQLQQQVGKQTKPPTPQQGQAAPGPIVPDDDRLLVLIQTTLIALNQANATSNYTVFRELGAPSFQAGNSNAKLTEIFADLRRNNLDLSAILLIQPKLLRAPSINADGMLRVSGFFPTQPLQVNFDLAFQQVEAQWLLFGIAVRTNPAQPVAIEPVPAQKSNPSPVAEQPPAAKGQ